jgi:pilus assembly protein CpaE
MRTNLHILALPASTQTAYELQQMLNPVPEFQLTLLPAGANALPDTAVPPPDVLLYEMPMVSEAGLNTLQAMLGNRHENMAVFVIGQIDSPALMRRLMQSGVRDVLHSPLEAAGLLPALHAVAQDRRALAAADRQTSVVSFINAVGGSGASLLAVNTATTLARRHHARVALLDFDLQFGKAALFLDLKPHTSIVDALRDTERLDQVFLKALMCEHASGVHLLAAPPKLAPFHVQISAVHKLIDTAAAMYDVVIIDLPRLISGWTLEAMQQSDKVMLLTQNNLSAIRDTRRLLDFLPAHGLPEDRIEVVNSRAMSRLASTTLEQMKKTLGRPQLHRVRNDYAAALAAEDQGLPLAQVAPQSALTEDSARLADHVWQLHHPAITALPNQGQSWFSRLLGRQPQAAATS